LGELNAGLIYFDLRHKGSAGHALTSDGATSPLICLI